jgi:excisionase family DNA binding protein
VSLELETGLRTLIAEVVRDELRKLAVPTPAGEYLSTHEAAAVAKVTPGTIRRWIHEGKLPQRRAGRLVRVCRVELEQLLRDGTRGPRVDRSVTPEALADRAFAARATKR